MIPNTFLRQTCRELVVQTAHAVILEACLHGLCQDAEHRRSGYCRNKNRRIHAICWGNVYQNKLHYHTPWHTVDLKINLKRMIKSPLNYLEYSHTNPGTRARNSGKLDVCITVSCWSFIKFFKMFCWKKILAKYSYCSTIYRNITALSHLDLAHINLNKIFITSFVTSN